MATKAQKLQDILEEGRAKAATILQDPRYSAEYAGEQARKAKTEAVQKARTEAAWLMGSAKKRTTEAKSQVDRLVSEREAKTDWGKYGAYQTEVRAKLSVAHSWDEVAAYIEERGRSPEGLRALESVGVEVLTERSKQDLGPLSDRPGEIASVAERLREDLLRLESPELQAARKELDSAISDETSLVMDIGSIGALWDTQGEFSPGGGNLFSDFGGPTAATTTEVSPGRYVTTMSSGGIFSK